MIQKRKSSKILSRSCHEFLGSMTFFLLYGSFGDESLIPIIIYSAKKAWLWGRFWSGLHYCCVSLVTWRWMPCVLGGRTVLWELGRWLGVGGVCLLSVVLWLFPFWWKNLLCRRKGIITGNQSQHYNAWNVGGSCPQVWWIVAELLMDF